MEKKEKYNVLWAGVTKLERGSSRVFKLLQVEHSLSISFPDNTDGMETYDEWKCALGDFDIIATDQENIDESWEGFFIADNWGKRIFQFQGEDLVELKPGFSQNRKRS